MNVPFTRKVLADWAGERVVADAEMLVDKGFVLEADYSPPLLSGTLLWANRPFKTALRINPDGNVENQCPCRDNQERGIICVHVIAIGLAMLRRVTDPDREAKYRAEQRRAARVASVAESAYLLRVPADASGAVRVALKVRLPADWMAQYRQGTVHVACDLEYAGKRVQADRVPTTTPFTFERRDEAVLFVLEDICAGPLAGSVPLAPADFVNLVRLHVGRQLEWDGAQAVRVNDVAVSTHLRMDLDSETGELHVGLHTELPFLGSGESPFYVVSGREGWAYGAGNMWPLGNLLPRPYLPLYSQAVVVPRPDVLRFLLKEVPALSKHARVESDITEDLFTVEPALPRFRLSIRGSPASLAAILYASYDGMEFVACKPDPREYFAIPDPADLLRYLVRNPAAETAAIELLAAHGLRGDAGDSLGAIVGCREVLNFLGGCVPTLRRRGWQVQLEGKVSPLMEGLEFATPVVRIKDVGESGWFDVGFEFEDGHGSSLSQAEIQRAILKGDSYIDRGGRTILIDSDAVTSVRDVFADCATEDGSGPGRFRMAGIYAGFVGASLNALDGVDVEAGREWSARVAGCNRSMDVKPVPLREDMETILRPYQKDGVNWLRFLEENGFCGLLADEMGLGKTVQTLVWLELQRLRAEARGRPALIVCPTSLVENWAEEAARFVKGIKVLTLAGPDRHEKWDMLPTVDMVVTSYALLRRDVDRYLAFEFSAVILDEAQHIKNRSTQNALVAKKLRACHRLVLTGTPVENSVGDLWSIMDFLMPGYLGTHDAFRQNYELPITRGGPSSEVAQVKLRRKIHPFLLRRLKSEVARDLPPKIEKVSACALSADQRAVYSALLESSRRRIRDMVAKQGFNSCRMEVLTTLMRLRQVCCHLDLLKLPELKAEHPSGKMELLFELLDEAVDSGHRVLVFSQFVSMLEILREELKVRNMAYCYLVGATKHRMAVVHRFNTMRDIPVFLISLKAGGTGLNLTGADMVIHFDPWWNPAVENQATDRAYRIGQKRTVYCHKLIARDTVEEKVLALQSRKKAVIDATVESDEAMVHSLSWEDVQELLSL